MEYDAMNMSSAFNPPPGGPTRLVMRQIFSDPTEGRINQRILTTFFMLVLQYSNASDKEKSEVMDLIVVLCLKLVAVWKHKQNYDSLEDRMIAEARSNPVEAEATSPVRLKTAQDLYIEFDGFLVQLKSTLDHMATILAFGLNLPFSGLTTFGDKGRVIIKQLRRNVRGDAKDLARHLAEVIEENQDWLELAIDVRDRMNHYKHGGVRPEMFVVAVSIRGDDEEVITPRLDPKQTVRELIDILMDNLFTFVEHFVGLAMLPRLPKFGLKFQMATPEDPNKPCWVAVPVGPLRALEDEILRRGAQK
jgi:hypothetical protein